MAYLQFPLSPLIPGLFALIGAFVGAWLTRHTEHIKWLRRERSMVFADFLKQMYAVAQEATGIYSKYSSDEAKHDEEITTMFSQLDGPSSVVRLYLKRSDRPEFRYLVNTHWSVHCGSQMERRVTEGKAIREKIQNIFERTLDQSTGGYQSKFKHQAGIIGIVLLVLLAGTAIGWNIGSSAKVSMGFDWRELSVDPNGTGYSRTLDALLEARFALPEINKPYGKAKFLIPIGDREDKVDLGYVVSVGVEKLDLEKVPEKYKIEEATFTVRFTFSLRDEDGFELTKFDSPNHSLRSGKVNRFKGKVNQSASGSVVDRTKDVVLHMIIEGCLNK